MLKLLVVACLAVATSASAQIDNALLLETARREGAYNPALVVAVIKTESGGNPRAVNQGHHGIMQLNPGTARMMGYRGTVQGLYDWRVNLRYGSRYINYQADRYGGRITQVLAAYNAGTAFICQRATYCTPGRFINHGYIKTTLAHYREILRDLKLASE
jgi:soluble lytic murein transglycosylase-like protein